MAHKVAKHEGTPKEWYATKSLITMLATTGPLKEEVIALYHHYQLIREGLTMKVVA